MAYRMRIQRLDDKCGWGLMDPRTVFSAVFAVGGMVSTSIIVGGRRLTVSLASRLLAEGGDSSCALSRRLA